MLFSFAGVANLLIIWVTRSDFGKDYVSVMRMSAAMSVVSLLLLIFAFKDRRIHMTPKPSELKE